MPGESLIDPNDLAGSLQRAYDRLSALEKTGVLPVGLIGWFPGAIPDGWLGPCDGSAYDTTRWGQLFSYLASGNLPNIAGRVVVSKAAAGTFATLGATGGAETHTLTAAESGMPAHNTGNESATHVHEPNAGTDFVTINGAGSAGFAAGSLNIISATATATESAMHVHAVGAVAASSAHSLMNPFIVLVAAIKA